MIAKKYYWLKLKEDFFSQKEIKRLRRLAGGDTYTVIYLKLLLISLKNEGKIFFDDVGDNFADELSLEIDESVDNVKVTINYLQQKGLLELEREDEIYLNETKTMLGSESYSAERVRRYRRNLKNNAKTLLCNDQALQSNEHTLHSNIDVTKSNTEIEIEKNKYNEQKKEKTNTLYDNYFEKLWGYYPKKRGKSKVSKKQKKKLYTDIGFENMKKAIEKYLVEVKDREEKYIMYGSTFFNSGYMDYLPKEENEKSIQNKKPKRTLYLNEQSKNKIYQLQEKLKEGIISTQEYKKKTEEIIQDQTEGGE